MAMLDTGTGQTNAANGRSDVGEVESGRSGNNLTYLLHLHVVDAHGPHLVTCHTSHDAQRCGQVKTFVQGGDHLMDGQVDGQPEFDVTGGAAYT